MGREGGDRQGAAGIGRCRGGLAGAGARESGGGGRAQSSRLPCPPGHALASTCIACLHMHPDLPASQPASQPASHPPEGFIDEQDVVVYRLGHPHHAAQHGTAQAAEHTKKFQDTSTERPQHPPFLPPSLPPLQPHPQAGTQLPAPLLLLLPLLLPTCTGCHSSRAPPGWPPPPRCRHCRPPQTPCRCPTGRSASQSACSQVGGGSGGRRQRAWQQAACQQGCSVDACCAGPHLRGRNKLPTSKQARKQHQHPHPLQPQQRGAQRRAGRGMCVVCAAGRHGAVPEVRASSAGAQHGAALHVDPLHRLLGQHHGLGLAVVEAAEAVPAGQRQYRSRAGAVRVGVVGGQHRWAGGQAALPTVNCCLAGMQAGASHPASGQAGRAGQGRWQAHT